MSSVSVRSVVIRPSVLIHLTSLNRIPAVVETTRGPGLRRSPKRLSNSLICQAESPMTSNVQTIPPLEGEEVTIIGAGRIGSAFAEMCPYPTRIVRRGERIEDSGSGPIIVCTRNNTLDGIVDTTPISRRPDLVFVQNGILLPWLTKQGLEDNTQALIYFGVAKLGEAPSDGITEVDPDGLTAVYGKHAETLCTIIRSGGLTCKVIEKDVFLQAMLEKLIWISSVMLVGTEHGVNAGEVDKSHTQEVSDLMEELGRSGSRALGIQVSDNMVERLRAYTRAVASFPCAVKEFEWRNGWFYELSKSAFSEGKEDPSPLHTSLLKKVGAI